MRMFSVFCLLVVKCGCFFLEEVDGCMVSMDLLGSWGFVLVKVLF